jgi:hypothetical protein
MPGPISILRALLIAAAVAAGVLLVLSLPWRKPHPARMALGWVLGIAAAFVAGAWGLGMDLRWPPVDDWQRFMMIVLPATVLAEGIAAFPQVPRGLARLLRAGVAAAAGRILLHDSIYLKSAGDFDLGQWTAEQTYQNLAILAGTLLAVWGLLGLLLHLVPSRCVPLALALTCAGAAPAIMLSSSASSGQLPLVVAAALIAATAASLLLPTPITGTAPIGIAIVTLFALLVRGRYFADLTTTDAALLFFAPLLCWVMILPPIRKLRPLLRGGLCLLLVAIPVAIAGFREFQASNERSQPPAGGAEDYYEQFYR